MSTFGFNGLEKINFDNTTGVYTNAGWNSDPVSGVSTATPGVYDITVMRVSGFNPMTMTQIRTAWTFQGTYTNYIDGSSPIFTITSVSSPDPNGGMLQVGDSVLLSDNYSAGGTATTNLTTFCFLTGTLISTPEGDVPVEELRVGDQVVTANGDTQQIFWVGKKTVATVFTPSENLPVLISAGALGNGLPKRDLQVMPAHAFLIEDALVVAGLLVNGTSIRRLTHEELGDRFTYFAIETESHSLILAEGAVSETRGNKKVTARAFDNADEYETLYGEQGRSYPALPHTRYRMGDSLTKSIWESVHGLQNNQLAA